MTIREALIVGQRRLAEAPANAHVDTPELDAALLLADALGLRRETLYANLPEPVPELGWGRFEQLLAQRCRGVPVSYLRGRKEFFGLLFHVGPGVLVPRPDTETLVEAALALAEPCARVHDACTGSGCVAIALKHTRPDLRISASDLSRTVVPFFQQNCSEILGAELPFVESDLLSSVPGTFDLITANPPYLTDDTVRRMIAEGWPEPAEALAGGPTGRELPLALIEQAADRLSPDGRLLLEADASDIPALAETLESRGWRGVEVQPDLAGRPRVTGGRRPA